MRAFAAFGTSLPGQHRASPALPRGPYVGTRPQRIPALQHASLHGRRGRLAPLSAIEQPARLEAVSEPEAARHHAERLLELFLHHKLQPLVEYMSELAVVKTVVRQHQARVAWESQQAAAGHRTYEDVHTDYWPPAMPPCPVPGASPYGSSSGSGSGYAWAPGSGGGSVGYSDSVSYSDSASYGASSYGGASSSYGGASSSYGGASSYGGDSSSYGSAPGATIHFGPPPDPAGVRGLAQRAAAAAAEVSAPAAAPDFLSVLDSCQAGSDAAGHLMDSYAMRHLVLSRPASLVLLSGIAPAPGVYVARALSTSLWGEKAVLTLTLRKRSDPEQQSTYSKQPHKQAWVLARIAGEPLSAEPLEALGPEHPPEAIVAAQVAAFKDADFDVAYALTSPVGRAVAGTRDRFRSHLQGDFRYQPLLMHRGATSIQRAHNGANTYLEVFRVEDLTGGSSLFIWVATRQLEGLYKDCWMVEYVSPVQDPAIIKILQMGH